MSVTPRANQPRLHNRLSGQAETPLRANASFCRRRLNQPWNRCFRMKTQKPVLTESPGGLYSKPLVPRYPTNWNAAGRKPSAASEMDNQADTILNSGGFTTNKPNCATQLAGRNYAHPWTSSVHAHRCIRATSPQVHVCHGRRHPPLHIPHRTDTSLSGKNNCRASIPGAASSNCSGH